MTLDLIVPHYNEPWSMGKKFFDMLGCQRGVDFNEFQVTLVHDGTDPFPQERFSEYPFKTVQHVIKHGGVSTARNYGLRMSEAKWVVFCDFDDMFANIYALHDILNVLDTDDFDLLWFDLLWQDRTVLHIRKERNPVFVHDKVFRRDFLTDNNIRFNEELTWCEDSAFLAVVEMEINHNRIGKIKCNSPIYLYNVRDGSLCNRPEIKFANLQSFFKRHTYVADEFLKRGLIDQYNTMCVRVMADSFYTLTLAPGINEDKSEHEARVWEWYDKHREPFKACKPENFDMVMVAVNRECFDGGEVKKKAFLEWIDRHERGE